MSKLLCFNLILLLILITQQREVFIDYGVGGEGRELLKFFYDVYDGFYVDIGAYDSIFASNTLNLYSQGWGGINVDANPDRLAKFFMLRPDQTNLNYAVGDNDTFMTLYELDEDSSSTVSPKVKQYVKNYKPVTQQIKVPSITMKQICQRYYYRKPIFLNLDIQGYGSKALQSNDWTNTKCVPEVIFSQINEETRQSGLELPETILARFGYMKQKQIVGLNQIYVHESVLKKYQDKLAKAQAFIQSLHIQSINSVAFTLASTYLRTTTQLFKHYDPKTDPLFYKFVKHKQVVDLNVLNQNSNNLDIANQNKFIIILHFHPVNNILLLSEGTYVLNQITAGIYNFYEIVVTKKDGNKYKAYVFDHKYDNVGEAKIKVVLANAYYYKLQQKKSYTPVTGTNAQPENKTIQLTNITTDQTLQKLLQKFTVQVQKQRQIIQRLQSSSQNNSKTLKDTFINNHNAQISILENIMKKVSQLNTYNQSQPETKKNTRKTQSTTTFVGIKMTLKNLITIQVLTFVMVIVMSIALCVSVCVISNKKRKDHMGTLQSTTSEINVEDSAKD